MALDRMAACQSWICFPLLQCHVFMVYVLLCWGVFFSVLRLYSKWSIVWGLKNFFFSSSLSSCKKLYFLNTLSPVLSTPLSYVCCVCMDRLMANFAGTCTSDNKGLLLLLLLLAHPSCSYYYLLSPNILFLHIYCFALFILLHILLFISLFYLYICSCVVLLLYHFIFIILHCPLSGPDLIYISLLIIPCIIYYVTNKETLNLEPWTHIPGASWVPLLLWLDMWIFCMRVPSGVQYEWKSHHPPVSQTRLEPSPRLKCNS